MDWRGSEAEASFLQADPATLTDDQVVKYVDVEELAGLHDLARDADVFGGWGWIARGVVVRDDHGCSIAADSFLEQLAHANLGAIERANVDGVHLDDMVLAVEQDRAQVFLLLEPIMKVGWR